MADKNQFTFDDDDDFPDTKAKEKGNLSGTEIDEEDDFPETDLSAVFSDGEHSAETPFVDEPAPKIHGSGNSRTRILLMVLLLVLVAGAGAYYFMGLGGTTPSVPTAPAPAKTVAKSVALPQQTVVSESTSAEQASKPVSVPVPPPVAPPAAVVAEQQPNIVAAQQPVKVAEAVPAPVEQPSAPPQVIESVPQPAALPVPVPVPVPKSEPVASLQPESSASPTAAEPTKQSTGGLYALDAGSYLLESNRDSLVAKARKLGYEPLITPLKATLDMTRLRIGTYGNDEIQAALDFARSIEPGSYSSPAGDGYVIYAGTFLKQENVDKLSQRFLNEGIKVRPEPVQVERTLSRIRFGSFATKEEAAAVARKASEIGLETVVVKAK